MKNVLNNTKVAIQQNGMMLIFKGLIISVISTLLLLFIFAILLTYTNIQENAIAPVMLVITGISILIGSTISMLKIKKNGLIMGGAVGLIYILALYIISSLVEVGFALNVKSVIMIIISIIAGMIGGIVGVNFNK